MVNIGDTDSLKVADVSFESVTFECGLDPPPCPENSFAYSAGVRSAINNYLKKEV